MATGDAELSTPAGLSTQDGPIDAVETADLLKRLQDSALGLLSGLDRPPSSLRIRADRVELQVDWPAPAAGPVGPAAVGPTAPAVPASTVEEPEGRYVTAHMVGVFYRASEPGAAPFVDVGDLVEPGQQVGIIEAMKLMMPVESDVAGRVVEVLADNGAPVEYGDRLIAIEPADS